jgi:hypothetical protein
MIVYQVIRESGGGYQRIRISGKAEDKKSLNLMP